MHQKLKDFEPDEVCDEGGVSGKSNRMGSELQGKERGKKTFARLLRQRQRHCTNSVTPRSFSVLAEIKTF